MTASPLARRPGARAERAPGPGGVTRRAGRGDAAGVAVAHLTVGARLTSVPRARAWTEHQLGGGAIESEAVRVAVLLTSEVVTNAVRYGPQPGHIGLRALRGTGAARIEVADGNPDRPHVRTPHPTATSGRGMLLVSRLATAWGVDRHATGKTVWFEVGIGPVGASPQT